MTGQAQTSTTWAQRLPVFTRAGVTTLDDLVRMTIEAAQRAQEISDARDVAAQLEQRVADQRDWTTLRAVRQRELAAAEDGLGDADREALAATARSLGITDLADTDRLLDLLRIERGKLVQIERKLEGELTAADATSIEKQKALATTREDFVKAQSTIEGDCQELLPAVLDKQGTLKTKLKAITAQIETLSAEADRTLTEAQKELRIAEEHRIAAEAEHSKVEEELRTAERRQATNEGELKICRETAAKLDENEARRAVEQVQTELQQVPQPPIEITDDMLAEARETVQAARNQLKEIENEIQAKRGALRHVGGDVAKQRAEAAQEALKYAREREQVLENDYTAWELLRTTLREAEQEEGAHLGRALGDPIAQRFSALTDRRYGPVALGPNLETNAISAVGDERSVFSLSVGTRDQLSTIFRLSLAEQLQSTVLLDDQLTQSDAQRMAWLRDLIRQLATTIQIIVFTCRPSDYLLPAELKPSRNSEVGRSLIRSINLAQVIERSGVTASPTKVAHNREDGGIDVAESDPPIDNGRG